MRFEALVEINADVELRKVAAQPLQPHQVERMIPEAGLQLDDTNPVLGKLRRQPQIGLEIRIGK